VVDEAQDFGNEAFRLIRALTPAADNDLFVAGDAHQRIYGHQVVLSRCGIDIRGRGRKLRINYRTTEEVKNWASGLLKGISFDDLDAGFDDAEGVRSLVHGEAPIVQACSSEAAAGEAAAAHIKNLLDSGSTQPEGICLVARTHRELDEYQKYMVRVCPAIHRVEPGKADDGSSPGLRLATMHRVKGLEFDHVVVVAPVETGEVLTDDSGATLRGRALLYVAATRARRSLYVCKIVQLRPS
jgi:superfamily I DNA/RNA helicase